MFMSIYQVDDAPFIFPTSLYSFTSPFHLHQISIALHHSTRSIFCISLNSQRTRQSTTMPPTTRHSTRQATEKANATAEPKKSAGTKRKGSVDTAPKKKREKEEEHERADKNEPSEAPKPEEPEETSTPTNGHKEDGDVSEQQGKDGTAVKASPEREEAVPSNILEKGIIYFFFRGRVGVEEPESMDDVARSFIVLRPLPTGAALGEGPIKDDKNCRLLALPKKNLPKSGDRFMGFVEKTGVDVNTLRESFVSSGEYETKTRGTREKPAATPVAEGVYALTTTERSSHLAYVLTIPSELDEVQKDFGLQNRGSFVVSSKNPKYPGPSSARLPQGPEYPQEIQDAFHDLRWVPLEPKFIEYPNAQILMIGERRGEFGSAVKQDEEDEKSDKEEPKEEIEQLEHENEVRADHLGGDHAIFNDLSLNAKKYPDVPTTWT